MNDTIHTTYGTCRFGSSYHLTPEHIKQLIMIFNSPAKGVNAALGGRTSVSVMDLDGIGSVLVKPYSRGGAIRYLVRRTYLRLGKPRCRVEYEQMQAAGNAGINVPEPIAYAWQGRLFYKAWLVTREIKAARTLAQLACTDMDRTRMALEKFIDQLTRLIHQNIFHADMHPGNVLVDHDNNIFIIDFDKARHYPGSRDRLRARYIDRWKRAVEKHDLPVMLLAAIQKNL